MTARSSDDYSGASPVPRAILARMDADERACDGFWRLGAWHRDRCDADAPEGCDVRKGGFTRADEDFHNDPRRG